MVEGSKRMTKYDGAGLHFSKRIGNVMGTETWNGLEFEAQERFRDDIQQARGSVSNLSAESQEFIRVAEVELSGGAE